MSCFLDPDQDDVFRSQLHCFPRKLAILLYCLCIAAVSSEGDKITCSIPSVQPLQDAVLTCSFPEDLSVTKKDFTIYHYVQHGNPDAVVDCWWLRGKLDCFTKPGFDYNKVVTPNVTVTIRQVKPDLTGTYACQMAGYGLGSLETCELNIKPGKATTCKITYSIPESQASLTCFFAEDIAETRRNFTVRKHVGRTKQSVMECVWKDEQPECRVETGFLYNYKVSSRLTLQIPEVTKETAGNYSCWHAGSDAHQLNSCSLDVADTEQEGKIETPDQGSSKTLAVVLPIALIVLMAAGVVFLLKYKRKILFSHNPCMAELDGEEGQSMLKVKNGEEQKNVEKLFPEYLKKKVKEMYPEILSTSHFVPPVYFNKVRYTRQSVAQQVVYIPASPDESEARHDLAVQHFLYCLRHMAEQRQEHMFVLTQFQYEDYLNNPGQEYAQHRLPVPGEDSRVGCLDFLIVHQQYGVVVGVVKSVSDAEGEGEQASLDLIKQHFSEGVQQLSEADRVIRHLMSDLQQHLTVRRTLILPSVKRSTLQRALSGHTNPAEKPRDCLGVDAIEDEIKLCLCAEDLSDPTTPWNVSSDVVYNLCRCWNWTVIRPEDVPMNDELYLSIISRFFGPATQSVLKVPDQYERFVLPKTLAEAVSLTGDLYERLVLPGNLADLLQEHRVLLSEPSVSGKTTMPSLAGSYWHCTGHTVFVVTDTTSKFYPVVSREMKLMAPKQDTQSANDGRICYYGCDFRSQESTKICVDTIMKKKKENPLCVIVDCTHLDWKLLKTFCETLRNQDSEIPLWIACRHNNYGDICQAMGRGKVLTEFLDCPPAVLRVLETVKGEVTRYVHAYKKVYLNPTDGPGVKHILHGSKIHPNRTYPHKCVECGREVGRFLVKDLLIKGATDTTAKTPVNTETGGREKETHGNASGSQKLRRPGSLHFRDILIVFEFTGMFGEPDVGENVGFLKGLRESGITVRVVTDDNQVVDEASDTARAVHVRHVHQLWTKRKIVVYVESARRDAYGDSRRLALTRCTSQLIWVHPQ